MQRPRLSGSKIGGSNPSNFLGAAMPWIARYEDYANCKKDIARGYGNIPRSTTRLSSLL
jgi:hypothetical protein